MRSFVRRQVGPRVAVLCASLLGLWAGCSSDSGAMRGGPTPAWVDRLPSRKGVLCAVGYSGPTFYQQDCVGNAAVNARGQLADTISATIRTVTLDISDGTRGTFSRDVFVEGSETVSQTVLQGSEVEAQWVDLQGQRGAGGGCYAMVCIDPSKPIESFMDKIDDKLPAKTVEKVRENAAAAFAELEEEEAKRSSGAAPAPEPKPEEPKPEEPKPEEPKPEEPKPEEPKADDAPAPAEGGGEKPAEPPAQRGSAAATE